MTELSDVRVVDPPDPDFDKLEETFDVVPLARTSIDDSKLPTPDQENFLDKEELISESTEVDDNPEALQ